MLALIGFVGLCILLYVATEAAATRGAGWERQLALPAALAGLRLLPPGAAGAFALLGVAGWRIWMGCGPGALLRLWGWQLPLASAWAQAMFAGHAPAAGVLLLVPALATTLVLLRRTGRIDPLAALMMVPYVVWIGYATALAATLWWLNRR